MADSEKQDYRKDTILTRGTLEKSRPRELDCFIDRSPEQASLQSLFLVTLVTTDASVRGTSPQGTVTQQNTMALSVNCSTTVHQEIKKCPKKTGIPPTVNTLEDLIRELHSAFEDDVVDTDYVQDLMLSYKSNPVDWKKYAKFDRYKYTRNLVDEGNGKFNLMLLCWGEGQQSAIHDHADAHCFMKMLDGALSELRFDWPENEGHELRITGTKALEKNSVCYINDSLGLHRVANPSHTDPAVSLHLYCPPFEQCHMFDIRTGKKTAVKVTFWSKFGQKVANTDHSCCEPAPADK